MTLLELFDLKETLLWELPSASAEYRTLQAAFNKFVDEATRGCSIMATQRTVPALKNVWLFFLLPFDFCFVQDTVRTD